MTLIVILQYKNSKMKRLTYILIICSLNGYGLEPWTVDDCIQYAVTHNHEVRLQSIGFDDYKAEKVRAIGSFLPAAEGNIGGQYNFGRAIDPETNTYTSVSTFYNSYGLSVGIPVFDGFQRYNNLRAEMANVLMGKRKLMAQKDATAQRVLETYVLALYYKGCIDISTQKRAESEMLLHQTKVMAEVGQKGEADVAQMQATYAADDYEVIHQQGLYDSAILTLKQLMNYPIDDILEIADCEEESLELNLAEYSGIYERAKFLNPDIRQAEYNLQSAKFAYRSSKAALFPSVSLGAGVSTTYYKQLNVSLATSFGEQFRNNAGQYVYASLSIPIFNRLNTLTNIRRQRNNVKRAEEELEYRSNELQRLIQEAITDQENSRKETEKMKAKVESDSIASRLTIRKYEEGLASSIDVQTQTVTLLQSKAQLLQCRLTYLYKTRILNYYKGTPLWTE